MEEKKTLNEPEIVINFKNVVDNYSAGNPQDASIKWVGLLPDQICKKLLTKGIIVSIFIIKGLLNSFEYKKRRYSKSQTAETVENRNLQFEKIASLKNKFLEQGLPILSIDTKNKEPIGNFDRKGHYFGKDKRKVNDHDFKTLAKGIVIPHGLYDVGQNRGYITLGTSKDTSEFVCDNIQWYWRNKLQWQYPDAECLLLLCDGGGSNNCNHYIVKEDLVKLAQRLQIKILVAHYPAYCSKWNPIEHKLFCHLHRAWDGAIFHNIQIVKELAMETSTKTGLEVEVRINDKKYETGRKYDENFKENISKFIIFDDQVPKWNYLITPN